MAAVWLVARRELRRRWVSLVLVGVIAGLAGGSALAAATVARRTATAYPRLEAAAALGDALVISNVAEATVQVRAFDGVERSSVTGLWLARLPGDGLGYAGITTSSWEDRALYRPVVVEGRVPRPDRPNEIVVAESFAEAMPIGQRSDLALLSPHQYGEFPQKRPPAGPTVTVEVVGLYRLPGLPDMIPPLVAGPGFAEQHGRWAVADVISLDADRSVLGDGDLVLALQELERTVAKVPNRTEFPVAGAVLLAPVRSSVVGSAGVLVGGLLTFAVVAALAGGFIVAQVLTRMHELGAEDQVVEGALGMTPLQRLLVRTAALALPAVLAGSLALVGAVVGGRFEPLGAIGDYEPAPGPAPNLVVLAVGAAASTGLVAGVGVITAWRSGRRRRPDRVPQASAIVGRLARIGVGPVGVTGVRLALEPGRGRTAVPTRTAVGSVAVAVAGATAVLVFAGTLGDLVDDPAAWGGNADLIVSESVAADEFEAAGVTGIDEVALSDVGDVLVGDRPVPAEAIEPPDSPAGWTIAEGRTPERPGEVTLGRRAASTLDLSIGDTLTVTDRRGAPQRLAVVGVGLGPPIAASQLGASVLVWPDDLPRVAMSDTFGSTYLTMSADADPDDVYDQISAHLEVSVREPPTEVDNLRRLGPLPAMLGLFLATIGLLALGNALVLATRRRRGDLAVLRAVGLTPRQTAITLLVMAVVTAVIGLVVGVPIGAAVGSVLWRAVAGEAAVPDDVSVPSAVLGVLVVVPLVALVLAVVPARRAAALRPAQILRTE
jgi:putative ABC transport system permease protein